MGAREKQGYFPQSARRGNWSFGPCGVHLIVLYQQQQAAWRIYTRGVAVRGALRTRGGLGTPAPHISGLNHAACILTPPGFIPPITETHAGSLLTGWLCVRQVGLEP